MTTEYEAAIAQVVEAFYNDFPGKVCQRMDAYHPYDARTAAVASFRRMRAETNAVDQGQWLSVMNMYRHRSLDLLFAILARDDDVIVAFVTWMMHRGFEVRCLVNGEIRVLVEICKAETNEKGDT